MKLANFQIKSAIAEGRYEEAVAAVAQLFDLPPSDYDANNIQTHDIQTHANSGTTAILLSVRGKTYRWWFTSNGRYYYDCVNFLVGPPGASLYLPG